MQLRILAGIELSQATRRAIERRVRLALGRAGAGIERVRITLAAGRDVESAARCRIGLQLRDGTRIAVEDAAATTMAVVSAALWRLEHRLAHARPLPGTRSPSVRRASR